jgi:hypothetical protein
MTLCTSGHRRAWGAYPPLFYPTFGFGPGFDIGLCFVGWGGWGGWGGNLKR